MATYVNDLRLKEIATGDESGTWGTSTNTNLELIGEAFSFGTEAITTNADTHTTTIADGSTDPGRSLYLKYTGTLDSACTITIGPNTVSKLWFIENGTSGSQNIIISQGSGANITIPPGDTKAIYSDGAGSGAAMVDAFASLSVVDLKVQDDLTVTDDMTVGGTLGVTGIVTLTDDLIIGDGKTIGSASDVDAMTIASNGQVTFTQTLIGTALDISGDIDVDGTTNLDVVDIDGAVDMASTLQVDGVATFTSTPVFSSDITVNDDIFLTTDSAAIKFGNGQEVTLTHTNDVGLTLNSSNRFMFRDSAIYLSSTQDGQLTVVADTEIELNATTIDINGNILASGTLGVTGVLTANAGVVVDNITIDGSEIDCSSGNLVLDGASNITLDADGGQFELKDGGALVGQFDFTSGSNFEIQNRRADGDITFRGFDDSSFITALTLDMSDAGAATFNGHGTFGDTVTINSTSSNALVIAGGGGGINFTGGNNRVYFTSNRALEGTTDGATLTVGEGYTTTKLTGNIIVNEAGADADFRVESDGNANMLFVDGGNDHVNIGTGTDFGGTLNVATTDNSVNLVLVCTDSDANEGPILDFTRDAGNVPSDNDIMGRIRFRNDDTNLDMTNYVELTTVASDVSNGTEDGQLQFNIMDNGTLRNFAHMTGTTGIVFNEDSNDIDFRVESNGNANMLWVDGGENKVHVGTTAGSQTISHLHTRKNGANIEFGHENNSAGYYGTLGAWGSAGHPYIGLSTDCEDSANTFSTRGHKGNLIYSNVSSGDLIFSQLTTASATGQTPTTRLVLNSSGDAQFYNRIFAGGGTGANTSVNADDIVIGLTDNSTERGITIASTAGGGIRWNDGADAGTLQYVHSTNRMQFYTGGSLRASIDSEGLKFNGDTSIVNALNDYETGTWTPAVSHGGTAATMVDLGASGSYTKIGRMVTLQGNAKIQTVNGTGAAIITGFPYTVGDTVANTGVEGNGVIGYYASWGDNVNSLVVLAVQSTTTGEIYGNHNASGLNSGATTITQAELNASAEFRFTLTYFTS